MIAFSTEPPIESLGDGGEVFVYVGVYVGVFVGEGVIVLVALAVNVGVTVGVAEGGTGVFVGSGVSVGGAAVDVGGTGVGSGVSVAQPPILAISRMINVKKRIEFFDIFIETPDLYKDKLLVSSLSSEHLGCIIRERADLLFVLRIHFYV